MTNERAIELLNRISDSQFDGPHGDERREALSMAVRALFSQQTVNDSQGLVNDCISRKMAIDAFEPDHYKDWYTPTIIETLEALPSAQPETHDKRTETHGVCLDAISRQAAQERQRVAQKRRYTFGTDEFSLEAAYHDCKLVFDGITDDDSYQEADTGLILYYANEIIYALQEALEGKDTDDSISRQAAIDALNDEYHGMISDESMKIYQIINWISALPSAQPERKKGKWIYHSNWEADGECGYECSECGMGSDVDYNYCMRCGARME